VNILLDALRKILVYSDSDPCDNPRRAPAGASLAIESESLATVVGSLATSATAKSSVAELARVLIVLAQPRLRRNAGCC